MATGNKLSCPICRQPVGWNGNPFRPFCSERCKMADLGNWALERYRIEGEPVTAEDLVVAPGGQGSGPRSDES